MAIDKNNLEALAKAMQFTRRFVPLKVGEALDGDNFCSYPAPEGMRWETDDEFRERILASR